MPSANVTAAIDNLSATIILTSVSQIAIWLLAILIATAVFLTIAMFATRRPEIGFPCAIFWFLAGIQSKGQSTAMWDTYFNIFLACAVAMTFLSILIIFALKKKPEETFEPDTETEEEAVNNDTDEFDDGFGKTEETSKLTKKVRDRAKLRKKMAMKATGR